MAFPTRKEWGVFSTDARQNDVRVERFVRAYFEDRRRAGAEALEVGDPGVTVRAHTDQEKADLRARIAEILNDTAAKYTAIAAQVASA